MNDAYLTNTKPGELKKRLDWDGVLEMNDDYFPRRGKRGCHVGLYFPRQRGS